MPQYLLQNTTDNEKYRKIMSKEKQFNMQTWYSVLRSW